MIRKSLVPWFLFFYRAEAVLIGVILANII